MSKILTTPGVYIEEKDAFPNTIVPVATAVPAFVGYTEKAEMEGQSLINKPTGITSLEEYEILFGRGPKTTYQVAEAPENGFKITVDKKTRLNLYNSLKLFFSNGGGACYIVSVGHYDYQNGVRYKDLNGDDKGISTLVNFPEPTLLMIPDAVLLEEADCFQLQRDMLNHCGELLNRVAILDIYNGDQPRSLDDQDVITRARDGWGQDHLKWGAAYYPFLNTTAVPSDEVDFNSISNPESLIALLNAAADSEYEDDAQPIKDEIAKLRGADASNLQHQILMAKLPLYKSILEAVRKEMNVLPPSGGMAGVICMLDEQIGVFHAPANVTMSSVISPTVVMTTEEQENLNVSSDGKSVNAIRPFPGKGVLVWGARTLDGNNQDWRYLNVRRTLIMLEQSLVLACKAFVFEPNDANTWNIIKEMMTNFLIGQWKLGTLSGPTPADAFGVEVGLGSTMTTEDILNGFMNIAVKVALSRPAEFIVITIHQQMQKS